MKTTRNQYWVYIYAPRATRRVLVKDKSQSSAYGKVCRVVRNLGLVNVTVGTNRSTYELTKLATA